MSPKKPTYTGSGGRHTMLDIMILLILKWSPRSPSSASWIRQAPVSSSVTSYLRKRYHRRPLLGKLRTFQDAPSPSLPFPLSCPFLKYGLLFPPSSALITVIPQQDCYSSIVSGQLTFDSALPPAWSMHNQLSDLLKNDHLVTPFPDPAAPPALNSFPWKQRKLSSKGSYTILWL